MVMWGWVGVGGKCRRRRRSEHDVLNGVGEEAVDCVMTLVEGLVVDDCALRLCLPFSSGIEGVFD